MHAKFGLVIFHAHEHTQFFFLSFSYFKLLLLFFALVEQIDDLHCLFRSSLKHAPTSSNSLNFCFHTRLLGTTQKHAAARLGEPHSPTHTHSRHGEPLAQLQLARLNSERFFSINLIKFIFPLLLASSCLTIFRVSLKFIYFVASLPKGASQSITRTHSHICGGICCVAHSPFAESGI